MERAPTGADALGRFLDRRRPYFTSSRSQSDEKPARTGLRSANGEIIRQEPDYASLAPACGSLDEHSSIKHLRTRSHSLAGERFRQCRSSWWCGIGQALEHIGECLGVGIPRQEKHAVAPCGDLCRSTHIRRDDRQTSRKRLELREAHPFQFAGRDEHIRSRQQRSDVIDRSGPV
jgi:hypothetical protein